MNKKADDVVVAFLTLKIVSLVVFAVLISAPLEQVGSGRFVKAFFVTFFAIIIVGFNFENEKS